MLIDYMPVSKSDGNQTLALQRDALWAADVPQTAIYEDLTSWRKEHRPGLHAYLKALRDGDTLLVWKLERLGRDLKHLILLIDELRQRKIGFTVLTGHGAQINTTTSNGRMIFGIFATLAEYERDLIAERTRAGLRASRAPGRPGGRLLRQSQSAQWHIVHDHSQSISGEVPSRPAAHDASKRGCAL